MAKRTGVWRALALLDGKNVEVLVKKHDVVISFTGESSNVEKVELYLGDENTALIHWKHRRGNVNVWRYDLDLLSLDVWSSTKSLGKFAWRIKRLAQHEVLVSK